MVLFSVFVWVWSSWASCWGPQHPNPVVLPCGLPEVLHQNLVSVAASQTCGDQGGQARWRLYRLTLCVPRSSGLSSGTEVFGLFLHTL